MKTNFIVKIGVIGIIPALLMVNSGLANAVFNVQVNSNSNPWTHLKANNQPDKFQFVVVPDRTGNERPGVFENAVRKINLLQPEFVVCVGDLVEGYSEEAHTYEDQWEEFDNFVNELQMPFFYACGNHDLANNKMLKIWERRFGKLYYHFVYNNVLFLVLDTEDPPNPPPGAAGISAEQIGYFRKALKENKNVRWTFVFMHRPMWTSADITNGFKDIEEMLQDQSYTVFAGHTHTYKYEQRLGRDYFVLATAGGVNKLRGTSIGEMDHIAWVTMRDNKPIIANILLDGIGDAEICEEAIKKFKTKVTRPNQIIDCDVITTDSDIFESVKTPLIFVNHSKFSMHVKAAFEPIKGIVAEPSTFDINLKPESCRIIDVALKADKPLKVKNIKPMLIVGEVKFTGRNHTYFNVPFSQSIIIAEKFNRKTLDFENSIEGCKDMHQCALSVKDGNLIVKILDDDPYFSIPVNINIPSSDRLVIIIRAKSTSKGNGQLFWATEDAPVLNLARSILFPQIHDGKWHEYKIKINPVGIINKIRLDPSIGSGTYEIDSIKFVRF